MTRVRFDEAGSTAEVLIASNTYQGVRYGAGVKTITVCGSPVKAVVVLADNDPAAAVCNPAAALRWLCDHGLPGELAAELVDYAIGIHAKVGDN